MHADYESFNNCLSKQKDGHEIWPDNDFVSSCQEFDYKYEFYYE